ncbi:hypothetical protein N007_09195 [Alicyclobacillus acidoterrestris ATCC 49025]|nr:hypothetical protein N007_09195 [Alicyclobacillus acidoterrestris ATCC 49025]
MEVRRRLYEVVFEYTEKVLKVEFGKALQL